MSSVSSTSPSSPAPQLKAKASDKEELERAHVREMEKLKQDFAAEKTANLDRFEQAEQAEKAAHYDHLRNLKAQFNREQKGLEHERTEVVTQKSDALRTEALSTEREGKARVDAVVKKYADAENFERTRAQNAEIEIKTDHKRNADLIISDSQKKIDALALEKSNYLDSQKKTHGEALEQIGDHYHQARSATESTYKNELRELETRATRDLEDRTLAHSSFLASHANQEADPFYGIKRFDSELVDLGDSYRLRVKLPEYERGHFKVQVSGQDIQLTGVRSDDQTAVTEPGRTVGTRTYQNITERFALETPIDGKAISVKEDGDTLEYRIPKFGGDHRISDQYRRSRVLPDDQKQVADLDFEKTLPRPRT